LITAGIDEAGRGALAGPVVAAAVILSDHHDRSVFKDSKQLSPQQREMLYGVIVNQALAVGVGVIDQGIIDRINILQATFQAMRKAISRLVLKPEKVLIDGNQLIPGVLISQEAIVKGDAKIPEISAASIVAKVLRDRIMVAYHRLYPQYDFRQHKGYGTEEHRRRIIALGLCPLHRQSFNHSIQLRLF
jgi:ribonuclease HII